MQSVLYAGLRNPGRDQEIHDALLNLSVKDVADAMKCAPSTVRAAARRISDLAVFNLTLTGGGKDLAIGQVAAKSFKRAALGAYRHFAGTFRNLELSTWAITDGTSTLSITDLRALDCGVLSVASDSVRPQSNHITPAGEAKPWPLTTTKSTHTPPSGCAT